MSSQATRFRLGIAEHLWTVRSSAGSLSYGLVAQSCSSATNFGLFVVAGHVIGVAGLGALSVGFFTYLFLLNILRALVTEPLVALSSARGPAERRASAHSAISLTITATVPVSAVMALVGLVLSGEIGRGFLAFAPWLAPALVQDLGRSIVFRDRAGGSAALSDATWLLIMIAIIPVAFLTGSVWAIVGCWGAGSAAGAAVTLWQVRWKPSSPGVALAWWKSEIWPFGRWLGIQSVLYSAIYVVTVFALIGILGTHDYGGLVAVQTVFNPLTLLAAAIALPGLPLLSRIVAASPRRALVVAAQIAALTTFVAGAYFLVLHFLPGVLAFVFGSQFSEFSSIIVPIGVAQILAAPTIALMLFLKAAQRVGALLALGVLPILLYMVFAVGLGIRFGLHGVAWAGVLATGLGGVALLAVLLPTMRRR